MNKIANNKKRQKLSAGRPRLDFNGYKVFYSNSRQEITEDDHKFWMNNETFTSVFNQYNWTEVSEGIYAKTSADVLEALDKPIRSLEDFKALISPAASPYLEEMAQISHRLTQKRFGKTIQMYVPLYLSNEWQNICTYCFSFDNRIKRKTLNGEEILREANVIKSMGYDHVLLVTGEAEKTVGVTYLLDAIALLRPHFSHIAMEVQPLDEEDYATLRNAGLNTVLVYQETYHQED